jgi:mRNA interferase MazF
MRRFDLWTADLTPQFGTEPGKIRPVLIIQSNLLCEALHPSTIICPITSKQSDAVLLRYPVGPESGLEVESHILFDQIRAIDNRRLIEKIGELPEASYEEVLYRIKIVLDL